MKWQKLGEFITENYIKILVISCFLTIISVLGMTRLRLQTSMTDLLPENEILVQNYTDMLENFDGFGQIIIGIEGDEINIKKFIKKIKPELQKIDGVDRIVSDRFNSFIQENFFLLTKEKDINNLKNFFLANDITSFIAGLNDSFEITYTSDGDSDKMRKDKRKLLGILGTINDFLNNFFTLSEDKSRELATEFISGKEIILSYDRSLGLLFIRTPVQTLDIEPTVTLINSLEKVLFDVEEEYSVKTSVTGLHALARDEMVVSERDMTRSSLISLFLILVIFIFGFKLIRYSILAVFPLIIGIIWSMGLTYLIIGSLNLMTMMMGVILIGLGIDYSIHIISLFDEKRREGLSVNDSIKATFAKTIPGIVSGSITTAMGFFVFAFSSFKGFSEFGIVLGTGIICTLITSIFILPSLLMIFGKKYVSHYKKNKSIILVEKSILRNRWLITIIVFSLFVLSLFKMSKVRFETDFLKIEPKGLASIALNKQMIKKMDFSSDSSNLISMNLEEIRAIEEEIKDLSSVGSLDTITDYIPSIEKQKQRARVGNELKKERKEYINKINLSQLEEELIRLENNLIELSDLAYVGGEYKIVTYCDTIINSGIISHIITSLNEKNVLRMQESFIGQFSELIKDSNTNELITLDNLPEEIKANYIGKKGRFLSTIYPEQDVWQEEFQKFHLQQLKSYEEKLGGNVLVMLKVIEKAGSEGRKVMIWTVLLIYLVLLLDLRNFKYATLAMFPMIISFIGMIGIMGIFNIKFTMVNVIALPMIIGIGVDDGIHLIHRYRIESKLIPTLKSTGKAITMTTLTTIAAFGTLMLSQYRGFVGFGLLLTIGISLAYLMTVGFLVCSISIVDNIKE